MVFIPQRQPSTVWQFIDLPDEELERADLVAMNIAVAKGVATLANLDASRYIKTVDEWTRQFAHWLPSAEAGFHRTPQKWKNDLRFFRVGMLQGFLGHHIGIRYIEAQKNAKEVSYTNPSDLFLNGLIDTKQGTCGNMAALHVAMARRMGLPVSLACAHCHFLSRYDDGEVIHNIEATSSHHGSFASDPDEVYIERFKLPRKAIACGSDLRKLTVREMLGAFIGLRARHHRDIGKRNAADADYALSRVLFPQCRSAYIGAMIPFIHRGSTLFDRGELGHPDSLFEDLAPMFSPHVYSASLAGTRATVLPKQGPDVYVVSRPVSENKRSVYSPDGWKG